MTMTPDSSLARICGPWLRHVQWAQPDAPIPTTVMTMQYLDMDKATERLYGAMRERPDAGVRAWLDCALNGWGDDA